MFRAPDGSDTSHQNRTPSFWRLSVRRSEKTTQVKCSDRSKNVQRRRRAYLMVRRQVLSVHSEWGAPVRFESGKLQNCSSRGRNFASRIIPMVFTILLRITCNKNYCYIFCDRRPTDKQNCIWRLIYTYTVIVQRGSYQRNKFILCLIKISNVEESPASRANQEISALAQSKQTAVSSDL